MYEGEICDKFALALNQIDLTFLDTLLYQVVCYDSRKNIIKSSEIFIFLLFET